MWENSFCLRAKPPALVKNKTLFSGNDFVSRRLDLCSDIGEPAPSPHQFRRGSLMLGGSGTGEGGAERKLCSAAQRLRETAWGELSASLVGAAEEGLPELSAHPPPLHPDAPGSGVRGCRPPGTCGHSLEGLLRLSRGPVCAGGPGPLWPKRSGSELRPGALCLAAPVLLLGIAGSR